MQHCLSKETGHKREEWPSGLVTIVCGKKRGESGVILETEGSIWKIKKGHFFTIKKLKASYDHSLFATALIKQIFEKSMSLRAASGRQTQF